jgi:translation initiation factor 4G
MTEQAYTALQAELKTFGLWEVKVLFVDDEYELGKLDTAPKVGWGEAISSNFMWGVSKLLGRKPEEAGLPTSVPVPSPGVHSTLGPKPAPKAAAAPAPRAVPQPAPGGQQPGEFRALASHSWTQASIAAQGIGAAAVAAGAAIGSNVRDAVDHLGAPSVPDKDAPPTPTKDVSISPYEVATPVVKKEEVTAIQPETKTEGETGVVAEVNKDDAEDKVSEVADKVAAVKIEEPKIEEPKIVEPKIEEKKAEDAKVEEKEVEEAQNEIAKPEAAIKPEALIEEKIEKKEVADDVDMLDSAPATPAETATPTEADDEDEEEDDKADATESTEAVKTAPKKKNKKKGKKGKN